MSSSVALYKIENDTENFSNPTKSLSQEIMNAKC